MKNKIISAFEKKQNNFSKKHPEFRAGDTVRVHYKIQEGVEKEKKGKEVTEKKKFRIQPYEGVVLRRKNGTADASFTVRKISSGGVGVERTFPLTSPFVEKIEVLAAGIVRRARLYFLRDRSGKAAKIRSRYVGRKDQNLMAGMGADKTEEQSPETQA
jgi:large subunit ribosomal protein L19